MNTILVPLTLSICATLAADEVMQPLVIHLPALTNGAITFQIENVTDSLVTAYATEYTIVYQSGQVLRVSRTTDYAIGIAFSKAVAGLENVPQLQGLKPHSAVQFQESAPPNGMDAGIPVGVRDVGIRAAIFEDGTTFGDDVLIASILLRRHKDAEALKELLPQTEAVTNAPDRVAALRALEQKLGAAPGNQPANGGASDMQRGLHQFVSSYRARVDRATEVAQGDLIARLPGIISKLHEVLDGMSRPTGGAR